MSSAPFTGRLAPTDLDDRIVQVQDALGADLNRRFAAGEPDPARIEVLASAGLLGLTLPPAFGGAGGDYHDLARACLALGRIDLSLQIAVTVHLALSAMTIMQWGSVAQRDEWLARLAAGDEMATFALTEPGAGSDVAALSARATRTSHGDYMLTGEKTWISETDLATLLLFFATVDPARRHHGITAFLLPSAAAGVFRPELTGKLGVRSGSTGSVVCPDGLVPAAARRGEVGEGFPIALSALSNGLFTVGCGALGIIRECRQLLTAMLELRSRGVVPQLSLQALAAAALSDQQATALLGHAAALKNAGQPNQQATGLAKLTAARGAVAVADAALVVAYALGDERAVDLERHRQNAKGAVIYGGTTQIHESMQGSFALGARQERPYRRPALTGDQLAGLAPLPTDT